MDNLISETEFEDIKGSLPDPKNADYTYHSIESFSSLLQFEMTTYRPWDDSNNGDDSEMMAMGKEEVANPGSELLSQQS